MRRRIYFMLPDTESARTLFNDMLLARIEERHIRLLARRGMLPSDLPEANVLQKTDLVHGAELGFAIGGVAGIIGGILAVLFPPGNIALEWVTVLVTAVAGAMIGAWFASMAASQVPNSRLAAFHAEIARGKVLMLIDVPFTRVAEIQDLVARRHPEAVSGGLEPTIPAFP